MSGAERLTDQDFDDLYPSDIRRVSSRFWTPLDVARRAAELLVNTTSSHVLDVGSGVGKFCIVGQLHTRARFTGVEHRGHLVSIAREASARVRASRTTFSHATIETVAWERFDGFYFFNPFAENLFGGSGRLDDTVELTIERLRHNLQAVFDGLSRARHGARLATYYGIGMTPPPRFRFVGREGAGSDMLDLWVNDGTGGPSQRPPLDWP